MAGTIPLSLTQQFDEFGKPLSGALLYIIQAGTVSTPQQPYQDASLTILQPNPIQLDAAGRVPQFFLADGYIKVRLDDKFGVTQLARDGVLVIGPSAGGGGGGGVDPTTLIQTGAIQPFYGTGVLAGFVRMNGRTIGSASSGASERSNADCQALFNFLWNADSSLAVSPSRGVSSAADWAANKTIATPDARGRTLAGLGDMGSTDAGRLTATWFGAPPGQLGAGGGAETRALALANLPPITPAGVISNGAISISHNAQFLGGGALISNSSPGGSFQNNGATITASQAASTFTGSVGGGSSTPFAVTQPTLLVTIYIKL
ncbi:hypothetical protein ABIB83_005481 [Bradyrhizobium sp. I1.8.5]|uniref:hypothetical protein n=1 Tax=Bradyrhizobium sp. I1.8.5 TaxID=3156365 RepID=UPI003398610C